MVINVRKIRFLKSAYDETQLLGTHLPVFAFAGRSNVGKSSLINMLVLNNKIARVSSTPGKTITVNYFVVDEKLIIADLPGYGYARRSKKEKRRWASLMEAFFTRQENLVHTFVLIDSKVLITELDWRMFDWLKYLKKDFSVILTKTDKIKSQQLKEAVDFIKEKLKVEVFPSSAKNKLGRKEILKFIENKLKEVKP